MSNLKTSAKTKTNHEQNAAWLHLGKNRFNGRNRGMFNRTVDGSEILLTTWDV